MSGINKVLRGGPEQIILFDYLQCAPALPCVSKGMKAACESARDAKFRHQIELRDTSFIATTKAKVEEICKDKEVETVLARLLEETGRKFAEVEVLSRYWHPDMPTAPFEKIREIYASLLKEENPEVRENLAARLLICLNEADTQLETIRKNAQSYEQAHKKWNDAITRDLQQFPENLDEQEAMVAFESIAVPEQRDRAQAFDAIGESRRAFGEKIKEFIAQENLANRSKQVFASLRADSQQPRLPISEAAKAMHNSQSHFQITKLQKERLDKSAEQAAPDVDRYSRDNLLAREVIGVEAALEQDRSLRFLWRSIRQNLAQRQNLNNLPTEDASARDIRAWMNDNPQNFENCEWAINLSQQSPVLIREIGWLQGLKNFRCTGNGDHRLVDLPNELVGPPPELAGQAGQPRGLQSLEELRLEGHSFRTIPLGLQRLPALRQLSITRNEHPIREFPAWLDAKINRGFLRGLDLAFLNETSTQMVRLDRFIGLGIIRGDSWFGRSIIDGCNVAYADLPREEFADIPFNIWFRENVSIPNIWWYAAMSWGIFADNVLNIGALYRQGWPELIRALTLPLVPVPALIGFMIAAAVFLPEALAFGVLAALFISSLSPFINPILHNVIGPILEGEFADEHGMVHIDRNIPEEVVAQPAVQN